MPLPCFMLDEAFLEVDMIVKEESASNAACRDLAMDLLSGDETAPAAVASANARRDYVIDLVSGERGRIVMPGDETSEIMHSVEAPTVKFLVHSTA